MRIHDLTLTNIGPFTGTTSINFADLSQAGLFLLEGPTGAGKSTILDAIVFALYGSVAGDAAGVDRMRSQLAGPTEKSYVDMTFEVESGVYRVRRTPQYERLKTRGEGTTTQNTTIVLSRLTHVDDPTGTVLSSRVQEADAEIANALGLSRTQFVQTVLLPQGQFAAFLRAKPAERQTLLQRLFATEIYREMEAEFDEQRKAAQQRQAGAKQAIDHCVTAFLTAARCDDETTEEISAADPVDLPDLTSRICQNLNDVVLSATEELAVVTHREQLAAQALQLAVERNALIEKRTTLRQQDAELERSRSANDARIVLVGQLHAVQTLLPHWRAVERAREEVETSLRSLENTRRDLHVLANSEPELLVDLDKFASDQAPSQSAVDRWINAVEALLNELRPIVKKSAEVDGIKRQLKDAQARLASLSAEDARLQNERREFPHKRAALVTRLAEAEKLASSLPLLQERQQHLNDLQLAVTALDKLATERTKLDAAGQAALAKAQKAEKLRTTLVQARIQGMAAELASELVDGAPCPVCGSIDHPQLAAATPGHPTEVEIAAAEKAAEEARNNLTAASAALAAVEGRIAASLEAAGDNTAESIATQLAKLASEVQAAEAAVESRSALTTSLGTLDERHEQLGEHISSIQSDLALCTEETSRLDLELTGISQLETEWRANYDSTQNRLTRVQEMMATIRELDRVGNSLSVQRQHLTQTISSWEAELAASAISSESDFNSLVPRLDEVDELERAIKLWQNSKQHITSSLAEPAIVELPEQAEPTDLEPLTEQSETAKAELRAAAGRLGSEEARLKQATATAKSLVSAVEQSQTVLAETTTIINLAQVVTASSAENLNSMTLTSYVLVSRFRDVLAAANDRLMGMSDGRYSIEYQDEREGRSRRAGLGLAILDRHTEQLRSPGDLSGGETFYTALALALGLADVVVAEAGGIQLDTLFIDEGFGSLDPETLDAVLDEISRLRSGGRVVGVVSHVDELKQRISERIAVRKRGDGSSSLQVIS